MEDCNCLEYKCLVVLEDKVLLKFRFCCYILFVFSREALDLRDHEETEEKRAML